jgi:hypothetical protein
MKQNKLLTDIAAISKVFHGACEISLIVMNGKPYINEVRKLSKQDITSDDDGEDFEIPSKQFPQPKATYYIS